MYAKEFKRDVNNMIAVFVANPKWKREWMDATNLFDMYRHEHRSEEDIFSYVKNAARRKARGIKVYMGEQEGKKVLVLCDSVEYVKSVRNGEV